MAWAEVNVDPGSASGLGVTHTTLLFSIYLSVGCAATTVKSGGGSIVVTRGAVYNFATEEEGKRSFPNFSDFVGVAVMRADPPQKPDGCCEGKPEGGGDVEAASGGGADGGAALVVGGGVTIQREAISLFITTWE